MLRNLVLILVAFSMAESAPIDAAEELGPPTSARAVKARQEYEAAVAAARKIYLGHLDEAAELAEIQKSKNEVARLKAWKEHVESTPAINEHDKLAKVRMKLQGTTWTWNRPSLKETNRMTFHRSGEWSTTLPQKGLWVMATDKIAIASYRNAKSSRDELFLFEFDDDFTNYSVKAFGDVPTKFVSGQRINK